MCTIAVPLPFPLIQSSTSAIRVKHLTPKPYLNLDSSGLNRPRGDTAMYNLLHAPSLLEVADLALADLNCSDHGSKLMLQANSRA
jgi:hypothetical protein